MVLRRVDRLAELTEREGLGDEVREESMSRTPASRVHATDARMRVWRKTGS